MHALSCPLLWLTDNSANAQLVLNIIQYSTRATAVDGTVAISAFMHSQFCMASLKPPAVSAGTCMPALLHSRTFLKPKFIQDKNFNCTCSYGSMHSHCSLCQFTYAPTIRHT
eukprot:GHRQ01018955.1.p1 GENE.GHRQ01018955.1~~GHRQ01018955.1.p1  ORF type:complete len:112 (-),score=17.90 GHRQ01018955.1:228-563(-)